ncbi:MAG: polysaccharide biosynthesis/export family protein [Planctomycetota bacterium]|nr:polysaccharide biosynthesis/export family protein [Planctomycetota bacterium]
MGGLPGRRAVGICLTVAVFSLAGCVGPGHYRAARLPARFMAPPVDNVQQIDLSGLSNYSISNELINRGDVLEVTILTDYARLPTSTMPVRIGEDGIAQIPQIGRVRLAGIELDEAELAIAAAAVERNVFRHPHVTVTMKRRKTNRITVIGAVEQCGVVRLPRNSSSLLSALVAAGGLSDEAGPNVRIRRATMPIGDGPMPPENVSPDGNPRIVSVPAQLASYRKAAEQTDDGQPEIFNVNLAEAAQQGHDSRLLRDGDVVMVMRHVPKPIHVIGLVNKPDKYELPLNQELRVLDALAMAGDRSMQAADKVLIIRQIEGRKEPIKIDVSVKEAKENGAANVRLAPGDIVSVEETPATVVLGTLQRVVRIAVGGSVGLF